MTQLYSPALPALRMGEPLAVYVHWPWCKAKCPYCDFNSHAGQPHEEAYVDALLNDFTELREASLISASENDSTAVLGRPLVSLFFGGGTPSLMHWKSIARVIEAVADLGTAQADFEVTVECNPTSFESPADAKRFFDELSVAGVNRVSIGIQGLNDEALGFLGREHNVADALRTLDAAQAVFKRVNADVIYGLPGQTPVEWETLLRTLAGRELAHLSAYQLTIEPQTAFYSQVKRGAWTPVDSDTEAHFFETTHSLLQACGYENYEISNFCRPGEACRHNLHIWNGGDYAGVGAGAHGRLTLRDGTRLATRVVRQPEAYLCAPRPPLGSIYHTAKLDATESVQEAIFASLRLATGVDSDRLKKRFSDSAYEAAVDEPAVAFLMAKGLLNTRPQGFALSTAGWPLLDLVLQQILRPLPVPQA